MQKSKFLTLIETGAQLECEAMRNVDCKGQEKQGWSFETTSSKYVLVLATGLQQLCFKDSWKFKDV